jgi:hypothetical protein
LKNRLNKLSGGEGRKVMLGFDDNNMRHFDVDYQSIADNLPIDESVDKLSQFNRKKVFSEFDFS